MTVTLTSLAGTPARNRPRHTRYGPWQYSPRTLTLTHNGTGYELDLETMTTSARVLDMICQIAGKTWADRPTLGALVEAINCLLNPQATLCTFGIERKKGTHR